MLTSLGCDLLLIPLLERVPGRKVVRTSAALAVPTFIAFLLVPWAWAKVALMVGVRLSTIGWYPVMQGEAYAAAPGRSGTVAAINSLAGLFGGAIIWFIGVVANQPDHLAGQAGLAHQDPVAKVQRGAVGTHRGAADTDNLSAHGSKQYFRRNDQNADE